ncbi:type I secretion system ABC transporter/ HlyB family [Synechococcus sp. RS9909]|uniref:peptidase domain-containing ABC transporter n=1 Tax=unclassified Synechococcus TaxID=2626047 RepID=UPI00006906AA|nr:MULTISPECIES: peptidase domain-containing ABC transporter [unclassified Synechococcus]EAQ70237.1 putative multidrug efflux ABC transporter [Synechococcus sp. RS9917]QNI78108.1 type I secretion system ABC transporter/ HlyB family [Synechococcus sp. RS9909]
MTQALAGQLIQHDWFGCLSKDAQQQVLQQAQLLSFDLGQQLVDPGVIPGRVLILLNGRARLVGQSQGRLLSLGKFEAGAVLGAASLLNGRGIENLIASDTVTAAAISDELWAELYQQEDSFRRWCQGQLWVSETAALIQDLQSQSVRADATCQELLQETLQSARRVPLDSTAFEEAETAGRQVFLTSAWGGSNPGARITPPALPPESQPFPARLISLPSDLVERILRTPTPNTTAASTPDNAPDNASDGDSPTPAGPTPVSRFSPDGDWLERLRLIRAEGVLQETLACFQMLAQLMKLPFRRDAIEKVLREMTRRGQEPTLRLCGQIAAGLGLHVSGAHVTAAMGTRLQTPTLVPWKGSFALVARSNQSGLTLASPRDGIVELAPDQLEAAFPDGLDVLLLERSNATLNQSFGPSWFWPALRRHRNVLVQVLIASFVVQLFALANPLLIQVIIDKVITQRSLDTLQVLGIALVAVTLLEGVLGSLKTFLFSETTNRIDQRLGAEVIDHLLRLPLGYFDKRPVGELGSRISELEKIRNFLTGQALTTLLDAAFSVIYIVVMLIYSWLLTLIALAVLPIQIALTLIGAPLFRRQYRQAAEANAKTQSHLVEVLTGIQTVKSQNVEMVSRFSWQELYATYINRSFEKTISGTVLNQTSQVLQKLSQLLVLWVGATLVLSGDLTLGQLIAFRIISGYVTQPLLRLSSIWQNIQELKVSFERLADVIDTPQESDSLDKAKVPLPPIEGEVRFDNLSFRFRPDMDPVLKDINLQVKAGTFVGIVGQSGSGKSTLMKLLPRLYSPDQGRILIDGYDIDKVELYSLRRQIGIVPQDPLLFSGSISENIALTQPDAGSDAIVMAAKLADAHDFIMALPSGYSTPVGERGASLSGGQRQRIAIARTLLSNPKLLVLDEATSALDYETERRVCDNLVSALQDCTVFFITHRLATVRRADLIVVMHDGVVAEIGSHDDLIKQRGRYYALYRQQEAG